MTEREMQAKLDRLSKMDEDYLAVLGDTQVPALWEPDDAAFPGLYGQDDSRIAWVNLSDDGVIFVFEVCMFGERCGIEAHKLGDRWALVQHPGICITRLDGSPWNPWEDE